jgi:hypothetical protein
MKFAFTLGLALLAPFVAAHATEPAIPEYRSQFADYRPFTPEEPPKDWRQANEDVAAAGGHIGLMRPVSKGRPAAAQPAAAQPAAKGASLPAHSGHGSHPGHKEVKP